MQTDIEYKAELNIKSANRIMLVQMMQENEDLLRDNKTKIRTTYLDTGEGNKISDNHNQYGVNCNDVVTSLMGENKIYINRINEIKINIQHLKKESKVFNRNKNKKELYLSAFVAAAEILLKPEEYIQLENKALKLMQVKT